MQRQPDGVSGIPEPEIMAFGFRLSGEDGFLVEVFGLGYAFLGSDSERS
jgi:hypothetical protein